LNQVDSAEDESDANQTSAFAEWSFNEQIEYVEVFCDFPIISNSFDENGNVPLSYVSLSVMEEQQCFSTCTEVSLTNAVLVDTGEFNLIDVSSLSNNISQSNIPDTLKRKKFYR